MMAECKEEVAVPPGSPADVPRMKCLAIVCEKESSQVRLFGPTVWMDEAKGLIDGLAMSLTFSEQMSHLSISEAAASFLSRPDQHSRLDSIKADAGAAECILSRTDSGTQIAVKGTPMSIKDARIHIKHLESDARAGSSTAITAGQHGHGAAVCPVCFCDIEEADMYIMEPCGHAYCEECAPQLMKSGNLPIMCCKDGCQKPVCMEDIKIGITTGPGQYDAALQRAFNTFINQNYAKFGRCYCVNCKQVCATAPTCHHHWCCHLAHAFRVGSQSVSLGCRCSSRACPSRDLTATIAWSPSAQSVASRGTRDTPAQSKFPFQSPSFFLPSLSSASAPQSNN